MTVTGWRIPLRRVRNHRPQQSASTVHGEPETATRNCYADRLEVATKQVGRAERMRTPASVGLQLLRDLHDRLESYRTFKNPKAIPRSFRTDQRSLADSFTPRPQETLLRRRDPRIAAQHQSSAEESPNQDRRRVLPRNRRHRFAHTRERRRDPAPAEHTY